MKCSLCDKDTTSKSGVTNNVLLTKDRIREIYSYSGILKYILDQIDKIDLDYDNDDVLENLNAIRKENPLMKKDLDFLDEIHSFIKLDGMPL